MIDSRLLKTGDVIRRRRGCAKCKHRWTTYEREELGAMEVQEIREGLKRTLRDACVDTIDQILKEAGY